MLNVAEIVIVIATWVCSLIGFIWYVATKYAELQARIERNRQDINAMGRSLRERIAIGQNFDRIAISHIQEHLRETQNYRPPTLTEWDKD